MMQSTMRKIRESIVDWKVPWNNREGKKTTTTFAIWMESKIALTEEFAALWARKEMEAKSMVTRDVGAMTTPEESISNSVAGQYRITVVYVSKAVADILSSACAWSSGHPTERSIANAYVHAIENAEHYVYIENQVSTTSLPSLEYLY